MIRRLLSMSILLLLFGAKTSAAIQLRWSTGATDLQFTAARACTLLITAEPGLPLPPD